MGFRYAVLGAGMQGTAATYDLARHGDAEAVLLFDRDAARAEASAARVSALIGGGARVVARALDVGDPGAVRAALEGAHACLSTVPYFLNELATDAAIAAGCHFNDLGGNTGVVERQLTRGEQARARGLSVIPDCGVAPGMINTLAVLAMETQTRTDDVQLFCGGLPENRALPLGYKVLFSLEGLTNEYFGKALVLRYGRVEEVDTFDALETVELPAPLGALEAFTTSGGSSTCPRTFEGRVQHYTYKTLRYPGHHAALAQLKALGFLDTAPIDVDGHAIRPRSLFHALMAKVWDHPHEPDLLIVKVRVAGVDDQGPVVWNAELVDRQDRATGFTAMERTTAFSAAIVTAMQARGETPRGALPVERAVAARPFVAALERRGFPLRTWVERPAG
jgi:lysine 6-dehydrogenase